MIVIITTTTTTTASAAAAAATTTTTIHNLFVLNQNGINRNVASDISKGGKRVIRYRD